MKPQGNSFIGLYAGVRTEVRKSFDCEKGLTFATRFWKLKKNLTMVVEPMVNLGFGVCSNLFAFNIRIALKFYRHFKKCIKFYKPNRQYLIRKINKRKNMLKNS